MFPASYQRYVDLVPESDIVAALDEQGRKTASLLRSIDDEKASFRYAPDKWSVKGVVGHFTDAERIFTYRALAIARGEKKSLPGYDENAYATAADFDHRSMRNLVDDYEAVRRSTVAFFKSLSEEARGRGVGTRLVEFAERRIFSETPNVFLCVSSFNPRARALYERLGYELIGELKDYLIEGASEFLMRKTIGPIRAT